MKSLRLFTYSSAVALLLSAATVSAQESPYKFEFHGFVTGSMYYQDQVFTSGQGQGLLIAAPTLANEAGGATLTESGSIFGGDVRNTRFSFGVTGPTALGGTPRGYIELDFFGLTPGPGFGSEINHPRIRVAIAELKLGSTLVQVGQQNQLVVPQIPASVSHIANPWSYGAGTIGWRTPGIRVVHSLPAGPAKLELAAEVVKNKWIDPAPANTPATVSFGEADGSFPMIQGRIKADGKAGDVAYSAYLVGVYHKVDLKGFADSVTPTVPAGEDTDIAGYALEVGGNVRVSGLTLAANYYMGSATANMFGTFAQPGDIADWGAWVQAGFNVTKEFSIWGFYGLARPDEDDVRKWIGDTGSKLKNDAFGGMIRYAQAGYQVGLEGYQYKTTYATGVGTDDDTSALQIIGTVGYFF